MTGFFLSIQNAVMPTAIAIEHLEFQGACGVTSGERARLQPIAVDAELTYALPAFHQTALSGNLSRGLDYAAISARIRAIGTADEYVLLETLADRLADTLLREFSVSHLSLWVRKVAPPLHDIKGSVGIRLSRHRHEIGGPLAPAPFLCEVSDRLPRGRALDVAAGRGRNALYFAQLGYTVEAVDREAAALEELQAAAAAQGYADVTTHRLDLEPTGTPPPELGKERYDVISVFFYLYRPLFPMLLTALKPGGILVYETFLIENHVRLGHPRRREFCLEPNELLRKVESLTVLHYDEAGRRGSGPPGHESPQTFTARLLAQKR